MPYFLSTRFEVPGYYLGIPPESCQEITNVNFYNGTGVNAGVKLYFDAYLPPNHGKIGSSPGQNSTIIRIHGGGWTTGDKGLRYDANEQIFRCTRILCFPHSVWAQ